MALDKDKLSQDILTALRRMLDNYKKEGYDGDKDFAESLAKAFKDYGESGQVITADTGTVSSGAFTGAGQGHLELSDSDTYSTIYKATVQMKNNGKDDAYLAEQIKKSLEDMYNAKGIVKTSVNGAIATPSGSSVTVSGAEGEGEIQCDYSSVVDDIKSLFKAMYDNYKTEGYNGDEEFAKGLASIVHSTVSSGTVSTKDKGEISGASGSGNIS